MRYIESPRNAKLSALRRLYKGKERRAAMHFVVEGVRECRRALQSGFIPVEAYICPDILPQSVEEDLRRYLPADCPVTYVSARAYAAVAYRQKTEGILLVFAKRNYCLEDLSVGERVWYVLLEKVEKPGNLGAVLRTADAAGVNGLLIADAIVDVWHPNVIRASQGAVFSLPVVAESPEKLLQWIRSNRLALFAAALPAYRSMYEMDFNQPCVLAFGAEDRGLSEFWLRHADERFTIPMKGTVDSLNVSVSVAVSLYWGVWQRDYKTVLR